LKKNWQLKNTISQQPNQRELYALELKCEWSKALNVGYLLKSEILHLEEKYIKRIPLKFKYQNLLML
jgi:hypothetical protein